MALTGPQILDPAPDRQRSPPDEGGSSPLVRVVLVAILAVCAALAVALVVFRTVLPTWLAGALAPLLAAAVAILLASFPVMIGFVQATSKARQIDKLEGLDGRPVALTTYYKVALANLDALQPASLTQRDYQTPMAGFCITVVVCSLSVFLAYDSEQILAWKNIVLGGIAIIGIADHPDDITKYQIETFTCIAFAFFGAYVRIIAKLLSRINNNDVYPISFHFYTAWIIMAGIVAAVLRHILHLVPGEMGTGGIVLLGFAAGLSPDLFLVAIARRAFKQFSIKGDKDNPGDSLFPTNMNLLMIDGITQNEIDRLSELGITNAQVLSAQNPFLLWPRLPYDLSLLVDWIGQAQLYVTVRDTNFSVLRDNKVADIFAFHAQLSDATARPVVCNLIGLSIDMAAPLLGDLDADPSFVRLKAVRDAMALS